MSNTPRDVLIEIVAKFGEPLLASPLRTEGLLKDYCGEFRREIFVLVSCLRVGVVEQLRRQGGPSVKLVCARLGLKLEQNLAITSDVAKWAVESWAIALGLLPPEAATARLSTLLESSTRAPTAEKSLAALIAAPAAAAEPEVAVPYPTSAPAEGQAAIEYLAQEPESEWEVPDWAKPSVTIVVHPDDSEEKPTLREAVRDAAPDTCLLLKPGLYRESLVIKRNLQIRAEGEERDVILESLASSVFTLDGACLYLGRLVIKGVGGKDKKALGAVEVKSGHLVVEDCDMTSDSSTVVEVRGCAVRGDFAALSSPRWQGWRHPVPGGSGGLPRRVPPLPEQAFAGGDRQGLLAHSFRVQDQPRADGGDLCQRGGRGVRRKL